MTANTRVAADSKTGISHLISLSTPYHHLFRSSYNMQAIPLEDKPINFSHMTNDSLEDLRKQYLTDAARRSPLAKSIFGFQSQNILPLPVNCKLYTDHTVTVNQMEEMPETAFDGIDWESDVAASICGISECSVDGFSDPSLPDISTSIEPILHSPLGNHTISGIICAIASGQSTNMTSATLINRQTLLPAESLCSDPLERENRELKIPLDGEEVVKELEALLIEWIPYNGSLAMLHSNTPQMFQAGDICSNALKTNDSANAITNLPLMNGSQLDTVHGVQDTSRSSSDDDSKPVTMELHSTATSQPASRFCPASLPHSEEMLFSTLPRNVSIPSVPPVHLNQKKHPSVTLIGPRQPLTCIPSGRVTLRCSNHGWVVTEPSRTIMQEVVQKENLGLGTLEQVPAVSFSGSRPTMVKQVVGNNNLPLSTSRSIASAAITTPDTRTQKNEVAHTNSAPHLGGRRRQISEPSAKAIEHHTRYHLDSVNIHAAVSQTPGGQDSVWNDGYFWSIAQRRPKRGSDGNGLGGMAKRVRVRQSL